MFNSDLQTKKLPSPAVETVYLFDWLQDTACNPAALARAERLWDHLVKVASPLGGLRLTPQSPPHHAESDLVSGHVLRMLACVEAFSAGQSLAQIEDFARDKVFALEFQALETTLASDGAFLAAYAACHDLGKIDTVMFQAEPGSLGEAEGFANPAEKLATDADKTRYDKLRRAHQAKDAAESFFATYKITVHYGDHARAGASDTYASTRQAVLDFLQVSDTHTRLLAELIRAHMEAIRAFAQGPDAVRYQALAGVAAKAGLNVPVFLDLLPAVVFLDAVLGSLSTSDGTPVAETEVIFNLFRSEREAMPERHAAREAAARRGHKHAVQEILTEVGLEAQAIFTLLQTPYGPVRGQVMAQVYAMIRNPDAQADFGEHTAFLKERARLAYAKLRQARLTLD
ncbi:MAG: hypothetical protein WAZ14_00835 [Patescibacteria group bacterium]